MQMQLHIDYIESFREQNVDCAIAYEFKLLFHMLLYQTNKQTHKL